MSRVTNPALAELRRCGLLLKQDKGLPSVVGIVTGEVLSSSWWSHPRAKQIFALLEDWSQRTDVLETKLLERKVTFVFESLWPALLGVATCREAWQMDGLSSEAKRLLAEVNQKGSVEATGPAVKDLEWRLAVRTEQRHVDSGKHVLVLESWTHWAKRCALRPLAAQEGKAALEEAARSLGAPLRALPWHSSRR